LNILDSTVIVMLELKAPCMENACKDIFSLVKISELPYEKWSQTI